MNRRLLTTIVTRLFGYVLFIALLLIGISAIRLAQGQQQSTIKSRTTPEEPRNIYSANGTKTFVRVHDGTVRAKTASPQQNFSVAKPAFPSGTICAVESRAAHG